VGVKSYSQVKEQNNVGLQKRAKHPGRLQALQGVIVALILASIMSVSLVEIAYMLGCSGSNSFMTGWVMSDYGHPTEIITS
jgi:hypothetical protein